MATNSEVMIPARTKPKTRTGWLESVDGFTVPNLYVERNADGLYDVYVRVTTSGRSGDVFGDLFRNPPKTFKTCIFTGLESRKEAVRLARAARDEMFKGVVLLISGMASTHGFDSR